MTQEKIIYLGPEEEMTNVRERLENIDAGYIILVIPPQTHLRSHVGWRLLHSRVRELGHDVLPDVCLVQRGHWWGQLRYVQGLLGQQWAEQGMLPEAVATMEKGLHQVMLLNKVDSFSGPNATALVVRNQSRLTIAVDFDGHGIGKLLVPLIVRRQAHKEMPANVEALKRRVEAQQPQHPA